MTLHLFTHEETQKYDAREVADLLHKVYEHGKDKATKAAEKDIVTAQAEARLTNYRWLAAGIIIGAGGVLLYQVIA